MNTAHSNYTGRFKRTQSEAFGPYTSNSLEPMQEADDAVTDVALVLASVAAVALAVMAIFLWWWV